MAERSAAEPLPALEYRQEPRNASSAMRAVAISFTVLHAGISRPRERADFHEEKSHDYKRFAGQRAPVRNDYANSQLFVVKDPRICRLWPFWREVLDEFGAKPGVVIPVRNPLEVAASLTRRDSFVHAKSCLLWLRRVLDAEKATRDAPGAVVTYDALLADWQSVVATLGVGRGVSWPRRGAMAELEIERFLATQLRHHAIIPEQLAARGEGVDWVKNAYAALVQLSVTPEHKASMARLDRIGAMF